jgi:hypothetical protein
MGLLVGLLGRVGIWGGLFLRLFLGGFAFSPFLCFDLWWMEKRRELKGESSEWMKANLHTSQIPWKRLREEYLDYRRHDDCVPYPALLGEAHSQWTSWWKIDGLFRFSL